MKILGIKHLAIAVENVDDALARYQRFLGVPAEIEPMDLVKGGSREAHFDFGDVQIQLCQSYQPDHRFAHHIAAHGEGLHHVCLSVENIEQAVEQALAAGAELKECSSCRITGIHEHSEGWICFLQGESVPGMEIEFMQVYEPRDVPDQFLPGAQELQAAKDRIASMERSVQVGLAEYFLEQAQWRLQKAEEYPDDERNLDAAEGLIELAEYVSTLPDDDARIVSLTEQWRRINLDFEFYAGEPAGQVATRFRFNNPTEDVDSFLDYFAMIVPGSLDEFIEATDFPENAEP